MKIKIKKYKCPNCKRERNNPEYIKLVLCVCGEEMKEVKEE